MSPAKRIINYKDRVAEDEMVVALATFPDDEKALAFLESQNLKTTVKQLANKRISKKDEIEQLRREIAPKLEEQLTGDMLDEARYATTVIDMAIRRTEEALRRNIVADPARVARDLSQLRSQAIDKRLALEGRPTSITETRNQDEIIRSLEGMGVAKQVAIEATAVEDPQS